MTLKAISRLIDDKMKFECRAGEKHKIVTDYTPPYGTGQGPTSLELFLMSMCSCIGGTMAVLLRGAGKSVEDISVDAQAKRRQEHPTCFECINVTVKIKSFDADEQDVNKALEMTEQSICPVAAMIKGNVELKINAMLV